jgi:DNA mismatch endonuclease (patch repair protein)
MRSHNMAAIKGRDTSPELMVRKILHRLGYRFRLHRRDLPGTPDIVLPRYRTVIFVHGCFWHRHPGCRYSTNPKTRKEFWEEKFLKNVERDCIQHAKLNAMGWAVETIWECETRNHIELSRRLELIRIKCPGTYQRCCPLEVPALSTFLELTAFCFSWATS